MALRILTLNLLHDGARSRAGTWSERLPLCAATMRSRSPDVLAIQETTAKQVADLAAALPEYRILPGPASDGGRPLLRRMTPGEHCAILLRRGILEATGESAFWISHAPDRSGSLFPGTWLPRIVHHVTARRADGRTLDLYCVHLDMTPWSWGASAAILRRRLDSERGEAPQIVAGDFNLPAASCAWRHLLGREGGFGDAWQDAAERTGPAGTYHAGAGRPVWPGRIDRILIRPPHVVRAVETIEDHCGPIYPSDHFPILASIDL